MPVYPHASGLPPREHAMAGQPPEPSWQPAGQDQTQARAAWPPPPPQPQQPPQAQSQHPSFIPQGGAPQDGYGYPQQQQAPGYPPPGYASPGQEQGYQGQEQTFADQEHAQWQLPGVQAGGPPAPPGP